MTGEEYRAALAALNLSQSGAGRFLGVHEVTARKWAASGPPPVAAKMLRLMIALKFTPEYVDLVTGDAKDS